MAVGHIVPDRSLTIVDEHGRLVMDGEVGELVIKSRYVALGYWRDAEATARRFAVDPIDPGTRIYKTGDLARRRPNGLFEYIGRKDDQIKLRGHRIEPGEIATTLRDHAGVRDAFVVVRKNDDASVRSLAAYVEASPDVRDLSPRDLKAMLKGRLPPYMIPASIQLIDRLPRLPNLKIDRGKLAEIDAERATRLPAACETETEAQIAAVWADAFHLAEVGRRDDFYELGGDSLIASLIAARVYSETGVELDLRPSPIIRPSPILRASSTGTAACATNMRYPFAPGKAGRNFRFHSRSSGSGSSARPIRPATFFLPSTTF